MSVARQEYAEEILREQLRLAMKQLPTMQGTSFFVALALGYLVRDLVPPVNIALWLLLILGVVASRIAFYRRFQRVGERPFSGEGWKTAYLFLALFSGIVWGLSALLVFPSGSMVLISLFVLVVASLSAATTISHSSLRLGPTAWAAPVMLAYAVRCAFEGGEAAYTLTFLIVLYLFTILRYSFQHNSVITAAIGLKFENAKLVEEVEQANESLRQDIVERKQAELQRDRLIAELKKAITEIETLQGILPICSVCKRIRTPDDSWEQMEAYISRHSKAEFSHGYCPECADDAMADVESVNSNRRRPK